MENKLQRLQVLNFRMAFFHVAQALALLLLGSDFSRTITAQILKFDQASNDLVADTINLFEIEFIWLVVSFPLVSAFFHYMSATFWFEGYKSELKNKQNKYRWYEYSISSSLMMVLIAILSGVFDLASLFMIFSLNVVMIFTGLLMEKYNDLKSKPDWSIFNLGSFAGIVPWLVVMIYFLASSLSAAGSSPPTFVYFVWVTIFLFFSSFALNMYLQYSKKGKWADYLYGEKIYIFLSLSSKSALIWQVYAGTLQP